MPTTGCRPGPSWTVTVTSSLCREAVEKRDELIEHLCSLAPVQSLLDQILWHFGTDEVAEVTGRSRRIVKDSDGKLKVQNRPASANLT